MESSETIIEIKSKPFPMSIPESIFFMKSLIFVH